MPVLDKKTLEYLAKLGRIELTDAEEKKLLKDLQDIINYFQELQKIDTANIEPMTGGTLQKNIVREDKKEKKKEPGKLVESFPEKENDFLKVPPVFE